MISLSWAVVETDLLEDDGRVLANDGARIFVVGTRPVSEGHARAVATVREGMAAVLAWLGEPLYPGWLLRAMEHHGLEARVEDRRFGCGSTCAYGTCSDLGRSRGPYGCGGCCDCLRGCAAGWEEQQADQQARKARWVTGVSS